MPRSARYELQYLPNHLKPCFLSMGAFPEDFEIKARTLIQVWVAEGFLKVERLKSLEKVAEECLEDLSSRNLIMIRKRRFSGDIRNCGVHDLLRDLSLREAQKQKFLHVTSTRYVSNFLAQRNEGRGFSFLSNISLNDSSELSSHVARWMFFWAGTLLYVQNFDSASGYLEHDTAKVSASTSGNHLSMPKRSAKTDGATDDVLGLSNLEELSPLCFASCTEEVFSCLPNIRKLSILDAASDDASEYFENQLFSAFRRHGKSSCIANLEVLKLRDNEFEGRAWTLSDEDEFSQLKFLLVAEPRLENWEAGSVNFPNLQKLVMRKCIRLEEIPIDIGEICTLEVIELICCSSSAQNSAKEIREEQESMGNSCLDVCVYADDDESSSMLDFWRAVLD